ncbi:MAG: phosphate acyltransferase PlsX [Armatimonadetes bacterium]|nr:phosphate acyltransferase PlsX [Armatimonadota bacterium]
MGATLAVDAMGGDHAPDAIVTGALEAAHTLSDVKIILVGDETSLRRIADSKRKSAPSSGGLPSNVQIRHTSEVFGMCESPRNILRQSKSNTSLALSAKLVADGEAQAFFSAGNSGACMAAAIKYLGVIEGVDRPAIATILPNATGHFLLLDAGANTDCDEHNLLEFALMGSAYASKVMGKPNPTVGLVSIGEEEGKGNALTKSVSSILKLMPINYIGNIEGNDLYTGKADVVVCDGFVGNVILKSSEGAAEFLISTIRRETMPSYRAQLGAALMKPVFRRVKQIADYAEVGGAPLLGVRGGAVVGHGRSCSTAVANGIRMAASGVSHDLVAEIERLLQLSRTVTTKNLPTL